MSKRTAQVNERSLDKEQTSYDDLLDAVIFFKRIPNKTKMGKWVNLKLCFYNVWYYVLTGTQRVSASG